MEFAEINKSGDLKVEIEIREQIGMLHAERTGPIAENPPLDGNGTRAMYRDASRTTTIAVNRKVVETNRLEDRIGMRSRRVAETGRQKARARTRAEAARTGAGVEQARVDREEVLPGSCPALF